jgi:hypothetical protein
LSIGLDRAAEQDLIPISFEICVIKRASLSRAILGPR